LSFSYHSQQTIELDDTKGWHYEALTPVMTESIRFVVESVNKKNMVNSVRLYEIQVLGEPQAPVLIETNNPAVSVRLRSGQFTMHKLTGA
jgi:hypothetical protein